MSGLKYYPTAVIKFISGKLHQEWRTLCGNHFEWRRVESE